MQKDSILAILLIYLLDDRLHPYLMRILMTENMITKGLLQEIKNPEFVLGHMGKADTSPLSRYF